MKRISTLIVLLALTLGTLVIGCNKADDGTAKPADTNAVPAAPSTNK